VKIAGWQKCSLIDFPGKIAAVIFTQGCNFRCPFCHNPELWSTDGAGQVDGEEIFNYLEGRRGRLEGIVISGGEPTLQVGLVPFLRRIRAMDFATKLDTNGSRPDVLADLLEKRLLDLVAMDIKHIFSRYRVACGREVSTESIVESLRLLRGSGLDYELRTTIVPTIHCPEEVKELRKIVAGAPRFAIQNFSPPSAADPSLRSLKPFSREVLEELEATFKPAVGKFSIR
jgi:pyruvate formate lyase activating enzyme